MIPGVILAAGASSRMGRPKALLPTGLAGETFLSRITATLFAGGVDDVIVVTGADTAAVRVAIEGFPVAPRIVENRAYEEGQLSSLHAALEVVDRPGVRAMLVTLVDVPLVGAGTVRALLEAYRASGAPVVRPARAGHHGHPVIFDRSVFNDLRHADSSAGAKGVVHARGAAVLDVQVDDEGAFLDIDTPAEYARVIGQR
jgi:molybdenum cofactor cytidylyltransferase